MAVRLGATLDETEGAAPRQLLGDADLRPRGGGALPRPPRRAWPRRAAWPSGCASTSPRDLGYATRASEDPTADRQLAELCRARDGRPLRAGRRAPARGRAAAGRGAAADPEAAACRASSCSTTTCWSWRARSRSRSAAPSSARRLLPPGRGRGSSVSSIVCYLTGLSHIDPVANDLFLGRFLNEELTDAPDIDLDFPRDIREKLIPRVHERYGRERSALVAAFSTYRARGAVRDLGKALGLPPGEIERLARSVDVYEAGGDAGTRIEQALGRRARRSPRWRALAELLPEIAGLPRHLSQHPGGMVISTSR